MDVSLANRTLVGETFKMITVPTAYYELVSEDSQKRATERLRSLEVYDSWSH